MHRHHKTILAEIKKRATKSTQHTFDDSYFGNDHPRYPITIPTLRALAMEWMRTNKELSPAELSAVVTSLIEGKSGTEKVMAGIILDYATPAQRKIKPDLFNAWLDHLVGWAEVDTLCTGKFITKEFPINAENWIKLTKKLAGSKNINKRRASLVLYCSALSACAEGTIADAALKRIDKLKSEKDIMITKAISWVLRSMIKHNRNKVVQYVQLNETTLPRIAIRETLAKLKTGVKKVQGLKFKVQD